MRLGGKKVELVASEEQPQQIDLRDETSQKDFDEQVIAKTLSDLRGAMANLKVNYQIAKTGIQSGNKGPKAHPNQILADIIDCRKAIDLVVGLGKGLDDGPVPEPQAGKEIELPELVVPGAG